MAVACSRAACRVASSKDATSATAAAMSARWATHVSVTARLRSAAASDKTPLAEAAVGNIIVYDDDKKLLGVGLKKKKQFNKLK